MRKFIRRGAGCAALGLALFLAAGGRAAAADTLNWRAGQNRVSADIKSQALPTVLEQIAAATGWQVYLEPDAAHNVSAKFKDLAPGDALRLLLGNLNFALVPQTNNSPRLYVFRTSQGNATQLIRPLIAKSTNRPPAKVIPNELIVRLKPGAKIDDIARALGAKVIGRIDGLNAYRLQFSDPSAADAARQQLTANSDVASVDSNFVVDPPPTAMRLAATDAPRLQLQSVAPGDSGRVIVGLVDTAVQPVGDGLDSFLVKSISVAGTAEPDPNVPTHGTSMFENILRAASTQTGGSSSMQVLSVDVYGPNASSSTFDVGAGIVQAANNGANIINLSLGSPGDSQFLQDLITQVVQKGIPIFAAAGNDASAELYYPAAYPGVTSVTAGYQGKLASYANYGSYIDLMAPGSMVVYFGDTAYLVTGTSTATSFISGLTAGIATSQHVSPSGALTIVRNTPTFQFSPPH